ncbi:MAG: hypothetical protein FJ253_00465 [Phycisphaerae bacterium]|nr:hypothetical protein [Phycisphaerae bacterium]
MAVAAVAALVSTLMPNSIEGESIRFWWSAGPLAILAGVAGSLAFALLVGASTLTDGRGLGALGASLLLMAAMLLGAEDRAGTGALLVPIAGLALIGAVSIAAAPRPMPRAAPARDPRDADPSSAAHRSVLLRGWNLGSGLALAAVAVLALWQRALAEVVVPWMPPPLPALIALAVGATLAFAALIDADSTQRERDRSRRLVITALWLGLALTISTIVPPMLGRAPGAAVDAARVSMLAATASAALGSLLVRPRGRVDDAHALEPLPETTHGPR